jgi:ABC-type transport system substrate-binding protein
LDKPPEEQDWDISFWNVGDWYGHTGGTHLTFGYPEESEMRWIEYDPVYEKMWKDMARTVNTEIQEEKIRQMVKYLYGRAYVVFIYSPLTLYALNKEMNFVPQKSLLLHLKETSVTDSHWSVRAEKK